MLVFTRRVDEGIMIGDDIRIIVVGVNGGKVRLGFAAPMGVTVLRQELCDRSETAPADPAIQAEADPKRSR